MGRDGGGASWAETGESTAVSPRAMVAASTTLPTGIMSRRVTVARSFMVSSNSEEWTTCRSDLCAFLFLKRRLRHFPLVLQNLGARPVEAAGETPRPGRHRDAVPVALGALKFESERVGAVGAWHRARVVDGVAVQRIRIKISAAVRDAVDRDGPERVHRRRRHREHVGAVGAL